MQLLRVKKHNYMIKFKKIPKPKEDEFPSYSKIYIELLKDDDSILDHLSDNFYKLKKFIYSLPIDILSSRYADGKWTIKEVLVHLIDDERIFSYRALRYARNDNSPLHGFDQDNYAKYSGANERSLESIFDEYEAVRRSTILLFQCLPDEAFMRRGRIIEEDGNIGKERTVRALAYHIAGHELRHIKFIKEKYLNKRVEGEII
jgi:uncharacterized damage-inducible protein DinB